MEVSSVTTTAVKCFNEHYPEGFSYHLGKCSIFRIEEFWRKNQNNSWMVVLTNGLHQPCLNFFTSSRLYYEFQLVQDNTKNQRSKQLEPFELKYWIQNLCKYTTLTHSAKMQRMLSVCFCVSVPPLFLPSPPIFRNKFIYTYKVFATLTSLKKYLLHNPFLSSLTRHECSMI